MGERGVPLRPLVPGEDAALDDSAPGNGALPRLQHRDAAPQSVPCGEVGASGRPGYRSQDSGSPSGNTGAAAKTAPTHEGGRTLPAIGRFSGWAGTRWTRRDRIGQVLGVSRPNSVPAVIRGFPVSL